MSKLELKILNHPYVKEFAQEGDGIDEPKYWVYLKPGYQSDPHRHSIAENTLKEIWNELKRVTKCDCGECKKV